MSFFEIQIKVSSFLEGQLRGLQSRQICPGDPQTIGGRSIQLQQIEFGNNSIRHDVPETFSVFFHDARVGPDIVPTPHAAKGFRTEIAQDLLLRFTETNDILTRPNQPPVTVVTLPVTAVLALSYYPGPSAGCFLSTRFERLEWGPLPPLPEGVDAEPLKAAVQTLVSRNFASPAIPFDFTVLLPKGVTDVENAGVSVDRDLQRIVFRVAPRGGHDRSDVAWTAFHSGFISDRLQNADWALFIEGYVLEGFFTNEVETALAGNLPSEIRVISVGSTYSNEGGRAQVDTSIAAIYDLPDPLGTKFVRPNVHAVLSVVTPNTLTMDVNLPDLRQLAAGALGGLRTALQIVLGPFRAFEHVIIGEILDAVKPPPGLSRPECIEVSSLHQRCSLTLPTTTVAGTAVRFTAMAALEDGISLTGNIAAARFTPSVLNTTFGGFVWTPPRVSCGQSGSFTLQDLRENAAQRASLRAEVRLGQTGTTPVYFCSARVINDPLGVFPSTSVKVERSLLPTTIVIDIRDPGPAYDAVRYDLELLVTTTAGVRLVRLPPPPRLTPEIIEFLVDSVRVQLMLCDRELGAWFKGAGRFDLAWIVDPLIDPPRELIFDHLWRIEITGLPAGQSAALVDSANRQIVSAVARAGAPLRLTAVVPPAADAELMLVRHHPGDRSLNGEPVVTAEKEGIDVVQQLLTHAASIPLPASCRRILPSSLWGGRGLVAVLDDGIVRFDLSNPHRPARLGWWHQPGLRGACSWGSGLLAFGREGFLSIDGDGARRPAGADCEAYPVMDAIVGSDVIYVLTDETLEVRSPRLCRISSAPMRGGRCMTHLGRRLVVGGAAGLALYDTSHERRPALAASRDDLDVAAVAIPPDAPAGSVLAMLKDGSARTFTIRDGRFEESAGYAEAPWFAESVELGDILVTIGAGRLHLNVATVGEPRLVVPARVYGHPASS
jgi:hypothetical protein